MVLGYLLEYSSRGCDCEESWVENWLTRFHLYLFVSTRELVHTLCSIINLALIQKKSNYCIFGIPGSQKHCIKKKKKSFYRCTLHTFSSRPHRSQALCNLRPPSMDKSKTFDNSLSSRQRPQLLHLCAWLTYIKYVLYRWSKNFGTYHT